MGTRLFVGNLSYGITDATLRAFFEDGGTRAVVDAAIVLDRDTGRSRGFGFVELADDEAARDAVEKLDGAELDGRRIAVREARERAPRPRGDGPVHRSRPAPEREYVRGGDRGPRPDRPDRPRFGGPRVGHQDGGPPRRRPGGPPAAGEAPSFPPAFPPDPPKDPGRRRSKKKGPDRDREDDSGEGRRSGGRRRGGGNRQRRYDDEW